MRKSIVCMLAVVLTASMVIFTGCGSKAKSELKFGTGNSAGTYYAYAGQMSQLITDGISFNIKETAGSAANIRLLKENFLDIALVQSDILASAANGTGMFEGQDYGSGYSAVAAVYTEAVQIVVKADAGIDSIYDLEGKSVSVGEEESGVRQNAEQILQAYGLTFDDIDVHYMSFSDSADAMRSGSVSAFFITAGAPTSAITDLANDIDIKLLSIDDAQAKSIMGLYDGYTQCVIPSGTYNNQSEDVATLGVKAVIIARNNLNTETVKQLTKYIFQNAEKLNSNTCTDDVLTKEFAVEGIPVKFHPGAAAYYSEAGITVEAETEGGNSDIHAGQDE